MQKLILWFWAPLLLYITHITSCIATRSELLASHRHLHNIDESYDGDENLKKVTERYLNNDELELHLKDFVGRCAEIAKVSSIGRSVGGRDLFVIEISDRPGQLEAEPNVKYVGNVHGDEPTGRVLSLALAEWLCANWRTDARAKRLVTQLHLHLLASMNPDGFEQKSRENKAGRDLNRDFPDRYSSADMAPSGQEQPETQAVMNWTLGTRFTASASFHEGAIVANYPWDGTPNRTTTYWASPNDATFKHLARTYASSHAHMADSQEFEEGITNGAAWYPIYGSMQDWNYVVGGCYDLTLELSQRKWPREERLRRVWEDNRDALVDFALVAGLGGVRGRVVAQAAKLRAGKGREVTPLGGARVQVSGDEEVATSSGAQFGDFYRPLAPGSYRVEVTMEGFHPFSSDFSVPSDGSGAVLDVVLQPALGDSGASGSGGDDATAGRTTGSQEVGGGSEGRAAAAGGPAVSDQQQREQQHRRQESQSWGSLGEGRGWRPTYGRSVWEGQKGTPASWGQLRGVLLAGGGLLAMGAAWSLRGRLRWRVRAALVGNARGE